MLLTHKKSAFYYNQIYEFNYKKVLISPPYNRQIILLYETQPDLDNAISTCINEGLKRDQLCVHASVNLNNKDYVKNFSSRIRNYKENIEKWNLVLIDLMFHYVQAMVGNLEPFNNLKEGIASVANLGNNRKDKHIRLTADWSTLLFKNQHFNECILLEEWWHHEPFQGFCLCPYPKDLVNRFPHNAHILGLFRKDDIVIFKNEGLNSQKKIILSRTL